MTKKVQIGLSEDLTDPWPIAKFRELLDRIEAKVPDEYRQSVTLEFSIVGYDSGVCDIEAFYERPETSKEMEQREKAEAWQKTLRCQNDLRILAELKAKYESGTP